MDNLLNLHNVFVFHAHHIGPLSVFPTPFVGTGSDTADRAVALESHHRDHNRHGNRRVTGRFLAHNPSGMTVPLLDTLRPSSPLC
jgi:hypothetical protein